MAAGTPRSLVAALATALALATLAGCNPWKKKPRPVIYPADARTSVNQYAGTALSGPQSRPIDDAAFDDAWAVSARVITVDKPPAGDFQSVGPQARLVIGQDPSDVLAPSAQLVYAARTLWLKQGDSLESYLNANGPWDELQSLSGATAVGTTTSFSIALPDNAEKSAAFPRRRVRIEVSREQAGNAYQLAITSDDLVLPGLTAGQEKVLLDRVVFGDADRLVISVPMAFPLSTAKAVVIDLVVTPKAGASIIAAAKTQVVASADRVAQRVARKPASPEDAAIAAALDAINSLPPNRGALLFLADQTGALLTKNVLLAAPDDLLPLVAGEVRSRSQNLPGTDKATVGWLLDRATISAVSAVKEEDAARLLAPVQGALINYAGVVGRQLDLLQSVAKQSVNSRDLDAHIIAEHRIALEDTSPALRVRAYDWLNERGQGPANYDPLGSARARRAAIERYNDATTQPDQPDTTGADAATQPPGTQPATRPFQSATFRATTRDATTDPSATQPVTQPTTQSTTKP